MGYLLISLCNVAPQAQHEIEDFEAACAGGKFEKSQKVGCTCDSLPHRKNNAELVVKVRQGFPIFDKHRSV
jgi:hypothetical protein